MCVHAHVHVFIGIYTKFSKVEMVVTLPKRTASLLGPSCPSDLHDTGDPQILYSPGLFTVSVSNLSTQDLFKGKTFWTHYALW